MSELEQDLGAYEHREMHLLDTEFANHTYHSREKELQETIADVLRGAFLGHKLHWRVCFTY